MTSKLDRLDALDRVRASDLTDEDLVFLVWEYLPSYEKPGPAETVDRPCRGAWTLHRDSVDRRKSWLEKPFRNCDLRLRRGSFCFDTPKCGAFRSSGKP